MFTDANIERTAPPRTKTCSNDLVREAPTIHYFERAEIKMWFLTFEILNWKIYRDFVRFTMGIRLKDWIPMRIILDNVDFSIWIFLIWKYLPNKFWTKKLFQSMFMHYQLFSKYSINIQKFFSYSSSNIVWIKMIVISWNKI